MRCVVEVAAIRAEPRDDAEQVTQALLHEPLRAEERRPGWLHVVTAYGYPGWIAAEALDEQDGELPQASGATPLAEARRFLGSPYEWGGLTARGIDCSGLVHLAYRLTGVTVPRDSWQQEAAGTRLAPGEARAGDLVTYGGDERADHIAFWLEHGRILHSTSRDRLGVVEELEPVELSARRRALIRL